jgi:hypothetical protein
VRAVLVRVCTALIQAETPTGEACVQGVEAAIPALAPFFQQWGYAWQDDEGVCRVAREQIHHPHFYAIWQLVTAWGINGNEESHSSQAIEGA